MSQIINTQLLGHNQLDILMVNNKMILFSLICYDKISSLGKLIRPKIRVQA